MRRLLLPIKAPFIFQREEPLVWSFAIVRRFCPGTTKITEYCSCFPPPKTLRNYVNTLKYLEKKIAEISNWSAWSCKHAASVDQAMPAISAECFASQWRLNHFQRTGPCWNQESNWPPIMRTGWAKRCRAVSLVATGIALHPVLLLPESCSTIPLAALNKVVIVLPH